MRSEPDPAAPRPYPELRAIVGRALADRLIAGGVPKDQLLVAEDPTLAAINDELPPTEREQTYVVPNRAERRRMARGKG